jgi:hypothetical protein
MIKNDKTNRTEQVRNPSERTKLSFELKRSVIVTHCISSVIIAEDKAICPNSVLIRLSSVRASETTAKAVVVKTFGIEYTDPVISSFFSPCGLYKDKRIAVTIYEEKKGITPNLQLRLAAFKDVVISNFNA